MQATRQTPPAVHRREEMTCLRSLGTLATEILCTIALPLETGDATVTRGGSLQWSVDAPPFDLSCRRWDTYTDCLCATVWCVVHRGQDSYNLLETILHGPTGQASTLRKKARTTPTEASISTWWGTQSAMPT